jgi:hypothetical protein
MPAFMVTGSTILEDPNNVSGSKVSVRTSKGWRNLGTIESGYQFFPTDHIPHVLDLKIEWAEGKTPAIYNIKVEKN